MSKRRLCFAVAVLAAAVGILTYAFGLLHAPELNSVDARFAIRNADKARPNIVLVLIDATTFDQLNRQWPFPRSMHARVIDNLRKDGARAIAYDVQFTEPTTPRQDNALISAVGRMGGMTLATDEVDRQGHSNIFGGESVLRSVDAHAGNSDFKVGPGATIRKVPFKTRRLKSFGLVAAESATGEPITREEMGGDSAWIDFRGPPGTFQAIPFSKVLRDRFPPGTFRNRIVVIGAGAPSLQDLHPTSTAGNELMNGPELQANVIATALDGFPLQSSPVGVDIYLIVAMGLVIPLGSLRLRPLVALGGAIAMAAIYLVAAQIAFNAGVILPVVYPLLALTVGAIGTLAVHYAVDAVERIRTRDTFARFVPAAVVDEVLEQAGGDVRLGGTRREVTVLFSDIRGFTSLSETLEPDQVIDVLNRYLTEMTDAIMDREGTLVSYMGDGIMAVFGAPLEQSDHAERALAATRDMIGPRLQAFNEWVRSELEISDSIQMGVGLNSGPVMSGNVGSPQRMDYTAIGDTTNTASRLEGMTKGSGFSVFIADSTREQLSAESAAALELIGEQPVRGRAQGIVVWGLRTDAAGQPVPEPDPRGAAPAPPQS